MCWLPVKTVPGVSQEHSATGGKVEVSTIRSDSLEEHSKFRFGLARHASSLARSVASVKPSSRVSQ